MSEFLLDTNIIIAAIKGEAGVRERLEITPLSKLILSPVVLGELSLVVEKSKARETNVRYLASIVDGMSLRPIDANTAEKYARIRAPLERQGTPIGSNEYWIAAQALAEGAVLVTDNLKEFQRIQDLQVENWIFRP